MNDELKTSTAKKVVIMNAFINGAKIECVTRNAVMPRWHPVQNPIWDWYQFDYRIEVQAPKILYVGPIGPHGTAAVTSVRIAAEKDQKAYVEITDAVLGVLTREGLL